MSSLSHGGLLTRRGEKYYEMGARARCNRTGGTRARYAGTSIAVAASITRVNSDRAVMSIDNLRHNGQSQADAAFLRSHNRVEDLFPQVRRNARTSIFTAQFDTVHAAASLGPSPRLPRLDAQHTSARAHGIVGVLHQVHECLLAQTLIHGHERKMRLVFSLHANGSTFPQLSDVIQGTIENGGDVLRCQVRVERAREIQKTRDQRA